MPNEPTLPMSDYQELIKQIISVLNRASGEIAAKDKEVAALAAENERLKIQLGEAYYDVGEFGYQVDEYFQQKWGLSEMLAKYEPYKAAFDAHRAAQPKPSPEETQQRINEYIKRCVNKEEPPCQTE